MGVNLYRFCRIVFRIYVFYNGGFKFKVVRGGENEYNYINLYY